MHNLLAKSLWQHKKRNTSSILDIDTDIKINIVESYLKFIQKINKFSFHVL